MSAESEQYRAVCRAEFQSINGKLDRLDEAIRGNGRPGIQTRLDRLERFSHFVWFITGAAVSAGVAVVIQRIGG